MKLLVSPHADDETLFAAFVQIREQPQVVVCLQGRRARHLVRNDVREHESRTACGILGTEVEFIPSTCDPPDWRLIEDTLRRIGDATLASPAMTRAGGSPRHSGPVFAPLPERGGHPQHNAVGNLAATLWPGRTTFYTTYTDGGVRSKAGEQIIEQDGWFALKAKALACYRSQHSKADTAFHFHRDQAEYLSDERVTYEHEVKLNLGAGPNPLHGFMNFDPSYSDADLWRVKWRFEDGLGEYDDGSVDAITVSHVLMYVPLEQWPAAFSEMARVLAPDGVVRLTEDAIGGEGSSRQEIRPGAAVETTAELVLRHLSDAGLYGERMTANVSAWHDMTLVQTNYGAEPDVFHVEGWRIG